MAQSLAKIYIHLIFSTKNREPSITAAIRKELSAYLGGIFNNIGCQVIALECVADHMHALFTLGRTMSIAEVVEETKKGSSSWIKTKGEVFSSFYWQNGYGAFSVSQSMVNMVSAYIAKQEEHHRTKTFQEEYREFLLRHNIAFDEKYVWD